MCYLCKMRSEDATETPPSACTFYIPFIRRNEMGPLLDPKSQAYLPAALVAEYAQSIAALHASGDGNCLLHSVSRACWGEETYYMLLKVGMSTELSDNFEWYVGKEPDEKEEITHLRVSKADWSDCMAECDRKDAYLTLLHVFVLANMLRRPIIVYASDDQVERYGCHPNGVAGMFLPFRHAPGECHKRPICILNMRSEVGHFIPIVHVETEQDSMQRFRFPDMTPCFLEHLAEGCTVDDYLDWDCEVVRPPIVEKLLKMDVKIDIGSENYRDAIKVLSVRADDDPFDLAKKFQELHALPLTTVPVIANHIRRVVGMKEGEQKFPVPLPLGRSRPSSPHVPCVQCQLFSQRREGWSTRVIAGIRKMNTDNANSGEDPDTVSSEEQLDLLEAFVCSFTAEGFAFNEEWYELLRHILRYPLRFRSPVYDIMRVVVASPVGKEFAELDGMGLMSVLSHQLDYRDKLSVTTLMHSCRVLANMAASPSFRPGLDAHTALDTVTRMYNESVVRTSAAKTEKERELAASLRYLTCAAMLNVCVAIVAKSKEEPTCASSTGVAEPNVPRVIFLQLLSAASSILQDAQRHETDEYPWMAEKDKALRMCVQTIGTVVHHKRDLRLVCHFLHGFVPLLESIRDASTGDLRATCDDVLVMLKIA